MKRLLSVVVSAVLLIAAIFTLTAQRAPAAGPTEVGVALFGQNAFEFTGRVDQNGLNITYCGYLTHIHGLTDTLLFSNPISPSESTARFLYYGTATLTGRTIISNVFHIDAAGTMSVYYSETPAGTLCDTSGAPIVTNTLRYEDITNVYAPYTAMVMDFGELTQLSANSFTLAGQMYQLGRVGLQERITAFGSATRTDPIAPKSFSTLAGNAVVTGMNSFFPIVFR